MWRRFFQVGSTSISAGAVLTVPLFLTLSVSQWFHRPAPPEESTAGVQLQWSAAPGRWDTQMGSRGRCPHTISSQRCHDHDSIPLCLGSVCPGFCPSLLLSTCAGQDLLSGSCSARVGSDRATSVLLLQAAWEHLQRPSRGRGDTTPRTMRAGLVAAELSGAWGHPYPKSLPDSRRAH